MFGFLNKERGKAKDFLHFLNKKVSYQKDILSEKQLKECGEIEVELVELLSLKSAAGGEGKLSQIERRLNKLFPKPANDGWTENVEVIFVAVVLALALRAYFIQPFKIPTDSMKPTLWGIWTQPEKVSPPNPFARITDFALFGKSYHQVVAQYDGERLQGITQKKLLGMLPVDVTEVYTDRARYTVFGSLEDIRRGAPDLFEIENNQIGLTSKSYRAGEPIINYSTQTGDHVFVNKMIYNFRRPKQGEVFVFTTADIGGIRSFNQRRHADDGTQYYIKRCVGVPGVDLQVQPPYLLSDGKILRSPMFEKIYSRENGYSGYTFGMTYLNGPGDVYQVPQNHYWAMGDNSPNSFDSRGWGPVPEKNLVGTGLLVYWPFTSRWGLIR